MFDERNDETVSSVRTKLRSAGLIPDDVAPKRERIGSSDRAGLELGVETSMKDAPADHEILVVPVRKPS